VVAGADKKIFYLYRKLSYTVELRLIFVPQAIFAKEGASSLFSKALTNLRVLINEFVIRTGTFISRVKVFPCGVMLVKKKAL